MNFFPLAFRRGAGVRLIQKIPVSAETGILNYFKTV